MAAIYVLNHFEVGFTVAELILRTDDSLTNDEIKAIGNVIFICKSLHEVNKKMKGISFKLIPDHIYDMLVFRYSYLKNKLEENK